MIPVREPFALSFQKRFTLVGEKVGVVTLDDDYIEELVHQDLPCASFLCL